MGIAVMRNEKNDIDETPINTDCISLKYDNLNTNKVLIRKIDKEVSGPSINVHNFSFVERSACQ